MTQSKQHKSNNRGNRSTVAEQLRKVQGQVPKHKMHSLKNLNHIGVDGVDHVNIWDQGQTNLGKALYHATALNFNHPDYGPFESVEGFVGFLYSGNQDIRTRTLTGRTARDYVKDMNRKHTTRFENIRVEIAKANAYKLQQWPELAEDFAKNVLPFDNYYVVTQGENSPTMVRLPPSTWLIPMWTEIQAAVAEGREADFSFLTDEEIDRLNFSNNGGIGNRDNRELRSVYGAARKPLAVRKAPAPLTAEEIEAVIAELADRRQKAKAEAKAKAKAKSEAPSQGGKSGNQKKAKTPQAEAAPAADGEDRIDPKASHQAKFNGKAVDMQHPPLSKASADEIEGHRTMAALDSEATTSDSTAVLEPSVDLSNAVVRDLATGQVVEAPADGALIEGRQVEMQDRVAGSIQHALSKHPELLQPGAEETQAVLAKSHGVALNSLGGESSTAERGELREFVPASAEVLAAKHREEQVVASGDVGSLDKELGGMRTFAPVEPDGRKTFAS